MPVEYAGEEQALCAVGLVQPRQGVFMAAIQHLLVLCTPVEARTSRLQPVQAVAELLTGLPIQVVLLGVCCSGEGGTDLQLQPLPLYTAPSNGACGYSSEPLLVKQTKRDSPSTQASLCAVWLGPQTAVSSWEAWTATCMSCAMLALPPSSAAAAIRYAGLL